MVRLLPLLLLASSLVGCAGVSQVRWTRIDGAPCMTTHAKPTWYSAENSTDCLEGGKAVEIHTNHEDASIIGSPSAALLGLIAGSGL